MTLREIIYAALTSGSPTLMVYDGIRQQNAPPTSVVYQIIYRTQDEDLAGADLNLTNVHVQTDVYSTRRLDAEIMAVEVRALLRSAPDFQTWTTIDGIGEYEDETGLYRVRSEFSIWYNAPE